MEFNTFLALLGAGLIGRPSFVPRRVKMPAGALPLGTFVRCEAKPEGLDNKWESDHDNIVGQLGMVAGALEPDLTTVVRVLYLRNADNCASEIPMRTSWLTRVDASDVSSTTRNTFATADLFLMRRYIKRLYAHVKGSANSVARFPVGTLVAPSTDAPDAGVGIVLFFDEEDTQNYIVLRLLPVCQFEAVPPDQMRIATRGDMQPMSVATRNSLIEMYGFVLHKFKRQYTGTLCVVPERYLTAPLPTDLFAVPLTTSRKRQAEEEDAESEVKQKRTRSTTKK